VCWGFFELACFHIMWGDPYGKGSISICTWWWFVHWMMFDDIILFFFEMWHRFLLSYAHILQLMSYFSKYDIKRFFINASFISIQPSFILVQAYIVSFDYKYTIQCSLLIAHHWWTSISLCNMKRNHNIDRHDLFILTHNAKKIGCKKKIVIRKCNVNKHHYLSYYTNTHIYPCPMALAWILPKYGYIEQMWIGPWQYGSIVRKLF
jgi:hypothetical protein